MKRILILTLVTLFMISLASVAQAQATRTWVSGVGDDANPCSRTAPCKTYAGAISKTASGGIISTLDPGGFGAVTITKPITIDGSEQIASVLAAGTNGIVINAGSTGVVTLKNLEIHGAGSGLDGIRVLTAAEVNVIGCRIQNFTGQGIDISPSAAGTTVKILVSESYILNNTQQGIVIAQPTSTALARLTVRESVISGNSGTGVDIAGSNNSASIYNSVLSENNVGAQVQLGTSTLFLSGNEIYGNGIGLTSGIGGQTPVTRLTGNSIVNNTTGISGTGTTVGFQSNMIVGNGAGNSVTSTVIPQ